MAKINLKTTYLIITILAYCACNWFIFRDILTNNGLDMIKLVQYNRYDNLHGLLSADVLSAAFGFLPFGIIEARRLAIKNWYLAVAMIFLAGVGVAIPMFMYLRQCKIEELDPKKA